MHIERLLLELVSADRRPVRGHNPIVIRRSNPVLGRRDIAYIGRQFKKPADIEVRCHKRHLHHQLFDRNRTGRVDKRKARVLRRLFGTDRVELHGRRDQHGFPKGQHKAVRQKCRVDEAETFFEILFERVQKRNKRVHCYVGGVAVVSICVGGQNRR